MKPTTFEPLAHDQATSASTGNVATLARPANASACYLTVTTTKAFITFDGSTPSSTNGLPVVAGGLPVRFDVLGDIKVDSSAGTASIVDCLWVN